MKTKSRYAIKSGKPIKEETQMNSTLSSQLVEAPGKSEFQYRYRAYSPNANARALVVYLPHAWSIVDEPELAGWIEQKTG